MTAMAGVLMVLILGLSVGLGLLLVYAVRREGPRERDLDWESAERVARKDGGDTTDDDRDDRRA